MSTKISNDKNDVIALMDKIIASAKADKIDKCGPKLESQMGFSMDLIRSVVLAVIKLENEALVPSILMGMLFASLATEEHLRKEYHFVPRDKATDSAKAASGDKT